MEIKKLLKNGWFSATLLGCGWLQGGPNFCPNCGQCLKPPCSPKHCNTPPPCPGDRGPCIKKDDCNCKKNAPIIHRSKRWNKGGFGDRKCSKKGEWFCNEGDKHPKCCHCATEENKHVEEEHHRPPLPHPADEAK